MHSTLFRSSGLTFLIILTSLFSTFSAKSQGIAITINEIGTPYINTYLPSEYGAHEQNFQIVQSPHGFFYVANVTGVVEFDGQQWNVDSRVSDDSFKGVAIGSDGHVYATTKGLMGYFKPDSIGQLQFKSLHAKIPSSFSSYGDIRGVNALSDYLIFDARNQLAIYQTELDTASIITINGSFGRADVVDDTFYIIDYSKGLTKLEDGRLVDLPGTDLLKGVTVRKILRYSDNELLFITDAKGLFRYDFQEVRPWQTDVSDFLREHKGFSGSGIMDSYFAIGTVTGGLVIIDAAGRLIQKLNKEMGMGNDGIIQDVLLDKDKNLWVAQHGVISQIIINSPFTTINDRHGVDGYVLYFHNWEGSTYVSTATGVVVKNQDQPWQNLKNGYKPFQPISKNRDRVWMTVKHGDDFFSAGNDGFFQITKGGLKSLYTGERLWAAVSLKTSDQMIIGSIEGNLHLFSKDNRQWSYSGKIKGFNEQMDFLELTDEGEIWMTDSGTGVFKMKLNAQKDSVLSIRNYGISDGLPETERNRVFRHSDGLYFATVAGIYQYDKANDNFVGVEKFNKLLADDYVFRFIEMESGDIYGSLNPKGKVMLRRKGDAFELEQTPLQRILGHNSEYVSGLGGNDIWIAGTGIKRYASGYKHVPSKKFNAYVRSVLVSNKRDSLIYAGGNIEQSTVLKANENAIHFDYTASYFDKVEDLEFQSYLEGSEDTWAPWSSKTGRNYTNLTHGTYTFKVRAKNLYGDVSSIGEYTFTIFTPWYLTIWAFILYALLVGLIVWLIVKLNTRRLEHDKLSLEQTIFERTEEIRQQKETAEKDKVLIQQQADQLKELDKVKSRFFANISHELRTPLTLINAPLESLIESGKITDEEIERTLKVASKNGVSLLSLVEEILDLAKLQAGKLKLIENPVRLKEFLKDTLSVYTTGLKEKQIDLKFDFFPDENLAVLLDENKCGKIIKNLLSNALKFTHDKIHVQVQFSSEDKQIIQVIVTDNGKGIDAIDLPYIFDRYYQSEVPEKKAEGGTGIGLALAKELAELMAGSLSASSEAGQGSTFVFEIPLKEVKEETIVPLTIADNKALDAALKETLVNYADKFAIDKPVMLITEDHPEMRAFIAQTLNPYFTILQAENGKVALEILQTETVDIVISDVMMPLMDGFELLEAIKQDDKLHQISIVMLTARADQEDRLHALTLGIDDYLTKPFSAALFLARIKNILENRIKVIREFKTLSSPKEQRGEKDLTDIIKTYDLSEREVEVMELLSKRFSNAEISEKLFVSTNTVKYHVKNLYSKLGITSRSEVIDRLEAIE